MQKRGVLCITRLLVSVDMPNNIVGEADNIVTCPLCHLGKTLCFGLVLKSIAGKVDAYNNR